MHGWVVLLLWLTLSQIRAANNYVYYGNHFDQKYIDRTFDQQNRNWNNPNNWLVYSPLGAVLGGGVPGSDPSDTVTVKSFGGSLYPTNVFGTVAELRFIGPGASLPVSSPSSISVIELLEFSGTGGGADTFGPLRITLSNLGTLIYAGGGNLGAAIIENYGLAQAPGKLSILDRGTINNHSGFELNSNVILNTAFFNNIGRLEKIDASGVTTMHTILTNTPSGVIKVHGGTLFAETGLIANEGELWAASTNALVDIFGTAKLAMSKGSRFKGPGALQIRSRMVVDGDTVVENLILRGEIVGPGRLTLHGESQFGGSGFFGTISGTLHPVTAQVVDASPLCLISNGASVAVRGDTYLSRRLENSGVIRIDALLALAADSSGKPAALVNNPDGLLEGLPPGTGFIPVGGVCTNFGLARFKNGQSVIGQVDFVNFGRVEVLEGAFNTRSYQQTTGSINVASNAFAYVQGPAQVLGGTLSGEGEFRFNGPTTIAATIRPGAPMGQLQILNTGSDATVLSSGTVVEIDIGGRIPGVEYDQLYQGGIGRTPTLGGTLKVALTNGFTPSNGDRFNVVTHPTGAVVGTFSNYDFPPLTGDLRWVPRYERDGLWLVVAQPLKLDAVIKADGKTLSLAWPSSLAGPFVLESTATLSPADWKAVTATIQDDGIHKSIALSLDLLATEKFFRLRNGP